MFPCIVLSGTLIFLPMKSELTTSQVAERFNVTSAAVRLWCRRGLLPNAREMETPRGPVWMIPESDLKDFAPPKPTGRPPKPKEEKVSKVNKKKANKK